jgi:hypothetical protein
MIRLFLYLVLIFWVFIFFQNLFKLLSPKKNPSNSKKILDLKSDLEQDNLKGFTSGNKLQEMNIKHTTIYSDNLLHSNKKPTKNLYRGADGRFKSLKNG